MRQIFCKLPNPFPYLNYITKFFFGRKSYRQRVFQGPLTLGLQSPSLRASSFRLACGNPSIPARSHLTAQTAHLLFCILLSASVTTDVSIPWVRWKVFLLGYPRAVILPRKPRTCYFCILLSASVTTDLCIPQVRSQVFLLGYSHAVISPR